MLESLKSTYFKMVEEDRINKHDLEQAIKKTNPVTSLTIDTKIKTNDRRSNPMQIYSKNGDINMYDDAAHSIALECDINFVPIEFLSHVDNSSTSLMKIANDSYMKAYERVSVKKNSIGGTPPSQTVGRSVSSNNESYEKKVIHDIDRMMKEFDEKARIQSASSKSRGKR